MSLPLTKRLTNGERRAYFLALSAASLVAALANDQTDQGRRAQRQRWVLPPIAEAARARFSEPRTVLADLEAARNLGSA
jgi:hypothetical protein